MGSGHPSVQCRAPQVVRALAALPEPVALRSSYTRQGRGACVTRVVCAGACAYAHTRVCVVWCGVVWCGVVRCGVVQCGAVRCGAVWCGVPKALLPKGKGRDVYPRVQVNGLGCVCCVRAVCKCVVA